MFFSWGAFLFVLYTKYPECILWFFLTKKRMSFSWSAFFSFSISEYSDSIFLLILPDQEKDVLFVGRVSFRSSYRNIPRVFLRFYLTKRRMSFSWGAFLFVLRNGIFGDYLFVILPDKEKDVSFVGPFLFALHAGIFRDYFLWYYLTNRRMSPAAVICFSFMAMFSFSTTEYSESIFSDFTWQGDGCPFHGARFFSFSITEYSECILWSRGYVSFRSPYRNIPRLFFCNLPDKEKDVPGSGDMLLVHSDVLVAHRLQLVRRLQAQRRPTG